MTKHFAQLIEKKQANSYINDTIRRSQQKGEMFSIIHEYLNLLRKTHLKAAPEETFFSKKWKYWDTPSHPKEYLKNLNSPGCTKDVQKVLRCLPFYSCHIRNPHVDSKPSCNLITESTSFHWTSEHEKTFQMKKYKISEDTTLAIPSTDYFFLLHVDYSNVGTGCIPT